MWLSIPIFHNPVTVPGTLGSIIVVGGVLLYNKARDYERRLLLSAKVGSFSCQQTVIADDLAEIWHHLSTKLNYYFEAFLQNDLADELFCMRKHINICYCGVGWQ